MLKIRYKNKFKKDIQKYKKRGKDLEKLKDIITKLANRKKLDTKYRDHKLVGNFKNRRSCHIEPDWVLVYKIEEDTIIIERMGSHAELYSL